jgi:NAD-dependent dihydropyrimidine dehydrogenase PreA subunit
VLLTGAVVFAVLCAVLFYAFRSGVAGIRIPKTGAALAASSLLALGLSGMVTFILAGDGASASTFALVYLLAGTPLAAYVWKSGCLSRTLAAAAAVMSVAFGFIVGAPLMPAEFVGLVGLATLGQTLTPGIVGILAGIGLVLVVGRTFCGQLCPVGSVQELAWSAPVRKIDLRRTKYLEAFRLVVFAASVTAALSLINLMAYTGVSDFFSLALTAGSIIFIALLALSAVFYRPVCRGLCPFGLLFSLPAQFSLYRLRRTDACVDCGKCEKACPVHAAGRDASKRECYLCARCTDACPVSGALAYGNRYG